MFTGGLAGMISRFQDNVGLLELPLLGMLRPKTNLQILRVGEDFVLWQTSFGNVSSS